MSQTWIKACALMMLMACGSANDDSLSSNVNKAEAEESFAALYDEILVPNHCTGCHGTESALNLATREDAYAQMVGVEAKSKACSPTGTLRVSPGDASESLLIHKLEGHDAEGEPVCGKPMPQTEPLDPKEIERVRAWIDEGAADN
jgi:hypothetical protein